MERITLNKKDIHNGSLILVNGKYPIVNEKRDANLSSITINSKCYDIFMDCRVATILSHLMRDLNCKDEIVPVSGYRSRKEQQQIYEDSISNNGKVFTEKYVALPNHSEHQTGLAIDLALKKDHIDFICPDFPYEGICNDFRKKAIDYGFIERYQIGKETITGIGHEPWHFRYVGYPHSKIMNEQGLSLEEYTEAVKKFIYGQSHFKTHMDGRRIELFYVPIAAKSFQGTINLPDNALYQISGNNVDGLIVTLWRDSND